MLNHHLPNEILFTIFKQLKIDGTYDGTLAECVSTCRQWKQPAQAALYSALTLKTAAVLDAIMESPNELGEYVQTIDYCMHFSEPSILKIALLFKNLVNFHCHTQCNCIEHRDKYFKFMLCLLKKGAFQTIQTIPSAADGLYAQENYEACLEMIKDRLTEITLTHQGEEIGTYHSLHKKLDLFPKLNTLIMDFDDLEEVAVWKDFKTVSHKYKIKNLRIQPSIFDEFLFDTPIIPEPGVETLTVVHPTDVNNEFMAYVMTGFPHLTKLDVQYHTNYANTYEEHEIAERVDLVLFLKYLYRLQTATGIFIDIYVEELPKHLLSLSKLLDDKQLQNTTFKLEFNGYCLQYDAAVINFTRNYSRNTIFIMLDEGTECEMRNSELMEKLGSSFYRLHLMGIRENLGVVLNTVSAHCSRLKYLIISDGGASDLDYSPSNQKIAQSQTVKRLEFRDYQITPRLFALINKQFPALEDLVLGGFNKWKIPGFFSPMIAPSMSLDYFRLRLDLYSEIDPIRFKRVFIKLETLDQEDRYYDLDLENPNYIVENYLYPNNNATEEDYQRSIDLRYMTFFIKCKSVAKFVPTFSSSRKH